MSGELDILVQLALENRLDGDGAQRLGALLVSERIQADVDAQVDVDALLRCQRPPDLTAAIMQRIQHQSASAVSDRVMGAIDRPSARWSKSGSGRHRRPHVRALDRRGARSNRRSRKHLSWGPVALAAGVLLVIGWYMVNGPLADEPASRSPWTTVDAGLVDATGRALPAAVTLPVEFTLRSAADAAIRHDDGSVVTLLPGAMLRGSQDPLQLHLQQGTVRCRVEQQQPGDSLRIRTTLAEVAVLGTRYSVTAESGQTRVDVDEGHVAVQRLGDGERVDVTARQHVVVRMAGALRVQAGNGDDWVFPGKAWDRIDPGSAGYDGKRLRESLASLPGACLVVRRGRIMWQHGSVEQPRAVYGITKAIAAIIWGTQQHRGIVELDQIVPGAGGDAPAGATWRHYLTMTSDYGFQDPKPGRRYSFGTQAWDHAMIQLGQIAFEGRRGADLVEGVVFDIIGRQDPVSFRGNWGGWVSGLELSGRDLARIGVLVASEGRWREQRMLSHSFVDGLGHVQIPTDATPNRDRGPFDIYNEHRHLDGLPRAFSFGWYCNNQGLHADLPRDMLWSTGAQGMRLIVLPSQGLVIVVLDAGGNAPGPEVWLQAVLAAGVVDSLP